ncbi:winged helix-turn-helix domain-containing protein [Niveispirillum sp. BGYR6]|uniref:ATP-binding protein n=1 Tax=Niveispirillum sp. BGYR6 TaxID=2971249 RepID=UPI0022B9B730|nr:winged helix-turn-helix domain-containing protein [Niveispirillum sp. BGYR6]MDG5494042.1 winged helix-turn-helix domain-containing protein [Niveispirillum sp. BGYR6]
MPFEKPDHYLLDTGRRRLLRNGDVVALGDRAFDLLLALAGASGEALSADELTALVWPGLSVSAGNLRVQVRALRKALGDGAVENVPGIGYRLTLSLAPVPAPADEAPAEELVGRDGDLGRLRELLARSRLVSIIGPGGVGKTCLALAGAAACEGLRVVHVELAPVRQPGLVPVVTAAALSIRLLKADVVDAIRAALAGQPTLLLLDNAEHLLDEVGEFAENLLGTCPDLHLLLTSREPLNISGELLLNLCPLACPPAEEGEAAAIRSYPAVALVLRNHAQAGWPPLADDQMPALAKLCRQLDGLPLALVLLAAQLRDCPVADVSAALAGRLQNLPLAGTFHYRHDSLAHMLDWSFDLLSDDERLLLSRLAVFSGSWPVAGAVAVCGAAPLTPAMVPGLVAGLVSRSLVAGPLQTQGAGLRLLETIRQYIIARDPGRIERERLNHALLGWLPDVLEEYHVQSEQVGVIAAKLDVDIADVRAILDWALGGQDIQRGQELVVAMIRVWNVRGLYTEAARYLVRAWDACDADTPPALRGIIGLLLYGEGIPLQLPHHQQRPWFMREEFPAAIAALRPIQHQQPRWFINAFMSAGWMKRYQGELEAALTLWEEALVVCERHALANLQSTILSLIGTTAALIGDLTKARSSLELAMEIGLRIGLYPALPAMRMAEVEFAAGDYDRAVAVAREILVQGRGITPALELTLYANLASYLVVKGDLPAAIEEALTGLRLLLRQKYTYSIGWTLERGALIAARLGRRELAAELMAGADAFVASMNLTRGGPELAVYSLLRDELGQPGDVTPPPTEQLLQKLLAFYEGAVAAES